MSTKPRVMIVDDEDTIRNLLKSRLEREGHDVVVARNAEEAQAAFQGIGTLITDLKMPGKDGFALMAWAKEKAAATRVIVITGHGEKTVAVKALREGASDYLEKPFDLDELSHTVRRCQKEYQLQSENQDLIGRLEARVERTEGKTEDHSWYVSKAAAMAKVNEWMTVLRREAMRGEAEEPTVLITGESGTGKEGIARMIHAGSRRARGPWVAVNCANFSEQLLESELFGHEKGSFTGANTLKRGLFEIAKGGTLFLDELGEMDVKLQARLLRVLQEKMFRRVGGTADIESDVRVVAATNVNITAKITEGKFREDLYHRINRVVVEIPSLQYRKEDIIPMATQFAEKAFRTRGKTFAGFSAEAAEGLVSYSWPGNVRELQNIVERTALLDQGHGPVGFRDLAISSVRSRPVSDTAPSLTLLEGGADADGYMELKKRWVDTFEKEYLAATLTKHSGNVSASAREAKLDRSNFLRLLRRHALTSNNFRKVGDTSPMEHESTGTDTAQDLTGTVRKIA
ncbi:MAG: sigma-54-dependent Fis family transcriptional regulator [Methylotenera sp.]|nr:sigma-54-dependent Fis family transcriptional regulator [Oligoflexia bacterium]